MSAAPSPVIPVAPASAAAAAPVPPSGGAAGAKDPFSDRVSQKSWWDMVKEFALIPFDKVVIRSVPEIGHLAPVILTMGTLFVSLVTLNYPLMVFGLSSVEAFLLYNTISGVTSISFDVASAKTTPDTPEKTKACSSFFQSTGPSRFKYFMSRGLVGEFPNSPLYFISFAAAYCIQCMYFFSKESSELGPQYSNRPYLGLLGAGMFIALYAIYLAAYGCDGIFNLIMTSIIGLAVGYLICYQNFFLFGKGAVDILFIPPLVNRKGMDYVCVTTNK